jgi:hypothetical protein
MGYWILIQHVGLDVAAKIKIQEATRAWRQGLSEVAHCTMPSSTSTPPLSFLSLLSAGMCWTTDLLSSPSAGPAKVLTRD